MILRPAFAFRASKLETAQPVDQLPGDLADRGMAPVPIIVGKAIEQAFDAEVPHIAPLFDRSVRAFGADIQAALGDLRIAVIGAGGTGSAVAEQLVRLGVRHLTLIDAIF